MSNYSEYKKDPQLSKGGMIGGLLGALISSKSYSTNDSSLKKAGKTGVFAALGYLAGEFLERLFARNRNKSNF